MTQIAKRLTAEQVAERLDVTAETVRAWCRAGKIPHIVLPNGYYRFRPEDIEALERGELEHVAQQPVSAA